MSTASPSQRGLTVTRRFTVAGKDPFASFNFVRRHAKISNADGSTVFDMPDVEVPDTWDQVAVDVLASKYFRKAGVPQFDEAGAPVTDEAGKPVLGPERSAKAWARRLVLGWRAWGERGGYFATKADADAFSDELAFMLIAQMGSPNSPQHFNTGMFEAYGIIAEPEGNWYWDGEAGEPRLSEHRYERIAASACYIQSVDDQLVGDGSIMDLVEREARLFKSGSGSGTNYSNLRESDAKLSAGGTASGLMSWIRVLDRSAGAIKSGGTTRRAARMVRVDVDHPDVREFIWCKVVEERKVAALVAGGYSADFNGDAYDTVAYQNGNNSVGVLAGFMDAVRNDDDWFLRSRNSDKVWVVKARDLWREIAEAAWQCADPGVQFDDLMNAWHTAANDGRIRGTNPCAEYLFLDDTACNLASINLLGFFDTDNQSFDVEAFEHAVRLWTLVLEITVSMSHYPSALIAERSYQYRTLGLGYANLGALLMRAGLPYDSDAGRAAMAAITGLMTMRAYATSGELAAAVGPCEGYKRNVEHMSRVLRNHRRVAYGNHAGAGELGDFEQLPVRPVSLDHQVLAATAFGTVGDAAVAAADVAVDSVAQHGARNCQSTVIAPTGTIGLQMSCDTTGIEPDFALVKFKKLAGGGYMRIVNASVAPALRALGYDHAAVERILAHALGTQLLDGPTVINTASLEAKGLTAAEIDAFAAALPDAFDLNFAAGMALGAETVERLGLDADKAAAAGVLSALGFSAKEIRSSSLTICGHQTVEGAPDLLPEHVAVFDCANYCGDGTRTIHWTGHVRALGAVAGLVSGSVSKTINMPNEATVEDIVDAYEMSYELGVKCCAIYRDGSKLSQVLSSKMEAVEDAEVVAAAAVVAEALEATVSVLREVRPGMSPSEYYHGLTPPKFRLPNMRYGPMWKFSVAGQDLFLRASQYPDGTLGEIFLDMGKEGSTLKGLMSAWCMAFSQGLQHGVPLEKFVDMFAGHTFEPRGMVGGDDHLKMCTSIVDAIVRILGHHYLGREELVQIKGSSASFAEYSRCAAETVAVAEPVFDEPAAVVDAAPAADQDSEGAELKSPFTGEACPSCGSFRMVKSGTCSRCLDCGSTTGCS